MALVGLGLPMIPPTLSSTDNLHPNQPPQQQPPSNLVIRPHPQVSSGRSPSTTGKVPACFFKILHQVPKAVGVPLCPEDLSRKSSNANDNDANVNDATDATRVEDHAETNLLTNRQLLESRIKSLRLEIGDLSIAENLEKLCDHYFKLDERNRIRSDEFNRKLSLLLNEKIAKRESAGAKTSTTVTFNLEQENDQEEGSTSTGSRKESSQSSGSNCCQLFGPIFHGLLSKTETESRLQDEGEYLIRKMCKEPDSFILSFRCNSTIQNYRIFKDPEFLDLFYLEDRKVTYASLDEMVNEGLRTLLLDLRAGPYIDTLTELAQINKHESMIFPQSGWLSSVSSIVSNSTVASAGSSGSNTRKSSYVGVVGVGPGPSGSKRPSVLPQQCQQLTMSPQGSGLESPNEIDEDEQEEEDDTLFFAHFFLPGTINLDKKSPCDLETCPLRQKISFCSRTANPNLVPSGKETIVCRDCGLTLHAKCQDRLSSSKFLQCLPDMYKIPEIFGADLTTLVKAGMVLGSANGRKVSQSQPHQCPFVVTKCVQEIERRGLGSEGIYRIPGSQEVVLKIQQVLERDRINADLTPFSDTDSLCGLLKMYLRQLPEPLISRHVFAKFMRDANDNVPLTLTSAKGNLTELPAAHKATLRYLLAHCDRVVGERARNKMSAYNLAVVLVPSLIIPEEMTLLTLKIATDVVDLLLRNGSTFQFLA